MPNTSQNPTATQTQMHIQTKTQVQAQDSDSELAVYGLQTYIITHMHNRQLAQRTSRDVLLAIYLHQVTCNETIIPKRMPLTNC